MKEIPLYKFMRKKYHKELLVDLDDLSFMRPWLKKTPVHRDNFYRIVLITDGSGEVSLNDRRTLLSKGDVICSMPGEVWHWIDEEESLEGYALLFEESFLSSFFSDPHFLKRQHYLTSQERVPFFHVNDDLYEKLYALFRLTKEEIGRKADADAHFLRAMLYGIMTLIGRAEDKSNCMEVTVVASSRYADRFIRLVNENFRSEHGADFYADKLCVTTNYLNKAIKAALGTSVKTYIQSRIIDEAKKLLAYTSLTTQEISDLLNFSSPTYFCRSFARNTGETPQQFRESLRSHEK